MKRYEEIVLEVNSNEEKFFSKITSKERNEVSEWFKSCRFKTRQEKDFRKVLKEALEEVNYDYWISNIEPSVDESTGKLIFAENKPVALGYFCKRLKGKCEAYNPERGSRMANLYELFIWYAYRIVKGYWTLNFVANDSSRGGNYRNASDASQCLEKTGTRTCGGFKDGQGNTCKIVTNKNEFKAVGGSYHDKGNKYPVSHVHYYGIVDYSILFDASCVVVLTK